MAPRAAAQAQPDTGTAEVEQVITDLARIVARMIVQASPGAGAATFTQLAVHGLKVATFEEAGRIEAWLTSHP